MRLISCHIENFGKLSNLTLDFSDGLNVIREANGWGKSTLAAFLKVMFYGMDSKKDASAPEKERILYRPWQGGTYGGELEFEVEGREYRIERTFGRSDKADSFTLYDRLTNLESEDYSSNLGVELFELDSASFKRSIYIAQSDCASATSDSINAKLGNLTENTDDINNFETAYERLKKITTQMTPDRSTGSIKKRKNEISALECEIRSLGASEAGMEEARRHESRFQEQIAEMQQIRKGYVNSLVLAGEDAKRRELYTQYENYCRDLEQKEENLERFKEVFPKGVPSRQELEEQVSKIRRLEEMQTTIRSRAFTEEEQKEFEEAQKIFVREKPTEEAIDSALSMLSEVDQQKEVLARQEANLDVSEAELAREEELPEFGNVHKWLLSLGIGVLFAGTAFLGAYAVNLLSGLPQNGVVIASVGAGVLGLLLIVIGVVQTLRIGRAKAEAEETLRMEREEMTRKRDDLVSVINARKAEVRRVHETISEFLGKYQIHCEEREYRIYLFELKNRWKEYEKLCEKSNFLCDKEEAASYLKKEILDFADEYKLCLTEDLSGDFAAFSNTAAEYRMADLAYKEAYRQKEAFEQRQDPGFWTKERLCPYSVEQLNEMIQAAEAGIEELKENASRYTAKIREHQENLDLRDEKNAELQELKEVQEKEIRMYNLLEETKTYLSKAKEQLTARYMEPISKGFDKYYRMLTGEKEANWMIDANINLKVREYGELRDTKLLSSGYQDLIGVCMRLAMVDAMFTDEKPFLILDDPFVNLDQEKVKFGNVLLLSVASEYQVIYFTCHGSRNPLE